MSDRCKNCGYCPQCGRSDRVRPWYPFHPNSYPYSYPYPYTRPAGPYWYSTGGTVPSNTISSGTISAGPIQGSVYSRSEHNKF